MTDIRKAAEPPLRPCPFCGGRAEFERTGTPRQSCIVVCTDCGARHESSDEGERSGWSWNRGVRLAAEQPQPEAQPVAWVAVSDRLPANPEWHTGDGPPPDEWVLVYSETHEFMSRQQHEVMRARDFYAYREGEDDIGTDDSRVITHWRPLDRPGAAPPPSAPCPHIRSSGTGEWATNWCALNGPPSAPEPSEAEVAAAMASLYRAMEPAAWPSEDEITDALRAAAAARNSK